MKFGLKKISASDAPGFTVPKQKAAPAPGGEKKYFSTVKKILGHTLPPKSSMAMVVLALVCGLFAVGPALGQGIGRAKIPFNPKPVGAIFGGLSRGWGGLAEFYGNNFSGVFKIQEQALAEQAGQPKQLGEFLAQQANQGIQNLAIAAFSLMPSGGNKMVAYNSYLSSLGTLPTGQKNTSPPPQAEVLGAHTTVPSAAKKLVVKSASATVNLDSEIENILNQYLGQGKFIGPQGPQGPAGAATDIIQNSGSQSTAVIGGSPIVSYVAPAQQQNFGGGSIAGFGQLSAQDLTAQNITAQYFIGNGSQLTGLPFLSQWASATPSGIYYSGNVGINTTTPAFPLDVNGIINATGLYVNGTPFDLATSTFSGVWPLTEGGTGAGSATAAVASLEFLQATSTASARSLQSKLADTISVKDFGAKGNGSTDDTAAIQAALNYASSTGATAYFPAGTYIVSSPLQIMSSVQLDSGAVIQASASMSAVIQVGSGGYVNNIFIDGGTINANNEANDGIILRQFRHIRVADMTVENASNYGFHVGDSTEPSSSYEAIMTDLHTLRTSGTIVSGSAGLFVDSNATDGNYTSSIFIDSDIGVKTLTGGNFFTDIHVWSSPSYGWMTVGFDDGGSGNFWKGIEADTVETYGLRARLYNTIVQGSRFYNNNISGSDDTAIGVYFDQSSPYASLTDNFFDGADSSHRFASDISASSLSTVTLSGNQVANVVSAVSQGFNSNNNLTVTGTLNASGYTITNNSVLRTTITSLGAQSWYLNSGSAEVGSISYSTPAGTPGIVFENTSGTGRSQIHQLSSSGGLGFGATTGSSSPSDALVVTTGNNVGIGTTTPTATFEVQGSAAATPLIVASSSGAQLLTILASGNVGIGSSNPTHKLEVTGANGTAYVGLNGDQFGSTASAVYLTSSGTLNLQTNGGNTRMLIDTSGNVGIGMTPSHTLDVNGTFSVSGYNNISTFGTLTGTLTATSSTVNGVNVTTTIDPASSSSATFRSLNMSATVTATSSISGVIGGWFETRMQGTSSITNAYGLSSTGLILPSAAQNFGTVSTAAGLVTQGVSSFSNTVTGTTTNAEGLLVFDSTETDNTITNDAGIVVSGISDGANNTALLLGTNSIPTGNFGIYDLSSSNNYFSGYVGIGTTTPGTPLTVVSNGGTGGTALANYVSNDTWQSGYDITNTSANGGAFQLNVSGGSNTAIGTKAFGIWDANGSAYRLVINSNGNVGIATNTPVYKLEVNGTAAIDAPDVSTTGDYLCWNTSTHEVTAGSPTCSLSSEKVKNSITPLNSSGGLEDIAQLQPVTFRYDQGFGDNGAATQTGFIAEVTAAVNPLYAEYADAPIQTPNGIIATGEPDGINWDGITAGLVEATQQLNQRTGFAAATTSAVELTTASSTVSTSTPWIGGFASASGDLQAAINSIGSQIVHVFDDAIYAATGIFDKVFAKEVHTDLLCVGSTCVTQAQFLQMVQSSGVNGASVPAPAPTPATTPTPDQGQVAGDSTTTEPSLTPTPTIAPTPTPTPDQSPSEDPGSVQVDAPAPAQ